MRQKGVLWWLEFFDKIRGLFGVCVWATLGIGVVEDITLLAHLQGVPWWWSLTESSFCVLLQWRYDKVSGSG